MGRLETALDALRNFTGNASHQFARRWPSCARSWR